MLKDKLDLPEAGGILVGETLTGVGEGVIKGKVGVGGVGVLVGYGVIIDS